jgi:hypothetical protein
MMTDLKKLLKQGDKLARSGVRFSVLGSATAAAICLLTGAVVAAPDDDNFFTHLHTDKAMANVTVSPGRSGPVDIAIQLETVDETPMKAKGVSVTLADTQWPSVLMNVPCTTERRNYPRAPPNIPPRVSRHNCGGRIGLLVGR